jgi:hypothetical protein
MPMHLAQMNVATALHDLDDPHMADFMMRLDDVNALAESSPGFVWRLQSDSGNATDIQVTGNPRLIVNMSVWESVEALFDFAYRSDHRDEMVKRRSWFEKPAGPYQVLWLGEPNRLPSEPGLKSRTVPIRSCGGSNQTGCRHWRTGWNALKSSVRRVRHRAPSPSNRCFGRNRRDPTT